MGRNQRLRKLIKQAETKNMRQAVETRKKLRIGPTLKLLRRFAVALVVTIFLLYGGVQVDRHLNDIIASIKNNVAQANK